jgi:hypothetical protein
MIVERRVGEAIDPAENEESFSAICPVLRVERARWPLAAGAKMF